MSKVLVVGGAGYIGGGLVDKFIESKYDVTVYDNLTFEDKYTKPVKFIFGDITDGGISKIVNNYDHIILLAGIVGDSACSVDKKLTVKTNVLAVKQIVDSFKGRIIFPSTCSVYGINDELITEASQTNPLSLYAETKLEAEQYILRNRPDSLIFRLGTLFGLGDRFSRPRLDLVVNILTMKATLGDKLSVFGGDQWRPVLHVKDVGNAMLYGITSNLIGLFNLSYENFTIKELAAQIVSEIPAEINYTDIPFQDARNYRVSSNKFLKTGWRPSFVLLDGIIELKEFFECKRIKDPNNVIYNNGAYLREQLNVV